MLLKSEGAMAEKIDSKVTYFLLGLGVGSLIGILFAPKPGEETREYLSQNVQKQVRGLQERAEDVIERGKEVISREKQKIAAAVEEGRETYQREKSKAKGA
jgi:gas vesicle protein